jgi:predicted nicotinamide N-methyase
MDPSMSKQNTMMGVSPVRQPTTPPTTEVGPAPYSKKQQHEEASSASNSSLLYDTDDDSYYAEFGFLFESNHPVRMETYRWPVVVPGATSSTVRSVAVSVAIAADDPPNSSSFTSSSSSSSPRVTTTTTIPAGLQVWPAATVLAEYLVQHYYYSPHQQVQSVVELGAGCGLVSLTALQLWQTSLQCLVVTDHDPNTLARARDNLESTMQALINEADADDDDDRLNVIINSLASIPVAFESLEWGDQAAVQGILRNQIQEHCQFSQQAHIILASDVLMADDDSVTLLFQTVHALMAPTGCFLLGQSIPLSPYMEEQITNVCTDLHLSRRRLHERHGCRIEEFSHLRN